MNSLGVVLEMARRAAEQTDPGLRERIAYLWRVEGVFQSELAETFFSSKLSPEIAETAVRKVLEIEIPDEEFRKRIAAFNISENGVEKGTALREAGEGIFSIPRGDRIATLREAHVAKGVVYWSPEEEIELHLIMCGEMPELLYSGGSYAGKMRRDLVAEYLNNEYHKGKVVRTGRRVTEKATRLKETIVEKYEKCPLLREMYC